MNYILYDKFMRLIEWIKNNKLASILIVIVLLFIYNSTSQNNYSYTQLKAPSEGYNSSSANLGLSAPKMMGRSSEFMPPFENNVPPAPDVKNRLTIRDSYLSLLVENVKNTNNKIINIAQKNGGYLVNSNINNSGEFTMGAVVIRVPSNLLEGTLEEIRAIGVKVISENITGYDVTDEYVDIKTKLDTLNKTKTKFEAILDSAVKVEDILNVTREIINLESQIESLKGQEQYYEKSAESSKITVELSTDELSLSYTPDNAWRPSVILKQAVRSLVLTLRGFAEKAIWLVVYAVIWIPALLIIIFVVKKYKNNTPKN